jgi:hypothetical protein
MRRLITRRIANLHFKYIATTPKGRRIDRACGDYLVVFPNMPTSEREYGALGHLGGGNNSISPAISFVA